MPKATDPAVDELVTIKKLLILGLIRSGMTQSQIGQALGVDRTTVSRMFPAGSLKGANANGGSK